MNKILTLLGFLLFTASAFAQISVTVSGNIADLDGNPTVDHDVNILVDSTFINFVYYNTVQTNADGDYSDTFEVPNELTQGFVLVWIDDCNNTFASQTSNWSPGGDPVIDFVYCNNNCSLSISEINAGVLEATAMGEAPFSYQWDDLSTSSTLVVNTSNYYCVAVTDAIGCTSNACYYFEANVIDTICYVYIDEVGLEELTAFSGGTAPLTYLWGTGESTQTISTTGDGEYCVSVTDATGCTASDCIVIDSCGDDVFINQDDTHLFANINVTDATYTWSTGETTSSIMATAQDDYCVTVTYGANCLAMDCYYFLADTTGTDCYVSIEVVQGGAWLQATGSGVAPYTYEWNTGESGSAIAIQGDTLYCVIATDAEGCVAYACYEEYTEPLQIQGYLTINNEDSIVLEATFNLYSIDGDDVELVATHETTAYYSFYDIAEGDYIVQAIAEGYLPTYHLSSVWWDEANVITASADYTLSNIELIPLEELIAGPGGITGTVTGPDEFGGGHETGSRDFEPIEGAEIILFNSENAPVAYMFTDAEGNYSFNDLPYGTYTVYIEIPGYEQVFYTVTISPDTELVDNINFTVNETTVTATKTPILENSFLSIFPNPVKEELNMNLSLELKGNVSVQVINITGQIVFNDSFAQYQQQKAMDVSSLIPGLYLVKVTTQEGIIVQQFVKE